MIALNDYTTDVVPMTSRHPSLHVIGGDATSRGYVLNQLSRVGFAAQEAPTPASLLVHESDQELLRRRAFWAAVEQRVAKLTIKDREVLDLLMECRDASSIFNEEVGSSVVDRACSSGHPVCHRTTVRHYAFDLLNPETLARFTSEMG